VAVVLFVLGWLGIVTEFRRPGNVVPGALGGLLALLALWSLVPRHTEPAAVVAAPLAAITLGLFSLAWRVRKQKLAGRSPHSQRA
jgi:membrane-bound ClpP family serine protease